MVNLSIDPPPFSGRSGRSSSGGGLRLRWLAYPALLAIGLAGGFLAGRKTAPGVRGPEASPTAAAPAGAAEGAGAAPGPVRGSPSAPAGPVAQAPAAAGPGAAQPADAARPSPPGAPQGPLVRAITVTLKGPLEESVAKALSPGDRAWGEQLTQVVNRILVWSMQIARDGRKGDKLEVLFELPTAQPTSVAAVGDGGPVGKEPIVLALRYGSQKLGRVITAYRFKPEGAAFARYYTSAGVEVEDHLVDSPVADYEQITSLLRDGRKHKGVDYKTPVGTAVRAPFDGEITRRNWHFSSNGNCLEVYDPKTRRRAIFLHLEAAPKEMQPGRKVAKGEVIAKSGNSGHSTAPHLHYQLEASDGRVLDPFAVLPTRKVQLEGAAKTAFDQERARLEPLLVAQRG